MNEQTTKTLTPKEFLTLWTNINMPQISMPTDHLSDAIARVKEYNKENHDKIARAHMDIKRDNALLGDDKAIMIDEKTGQFKFDKAGEKKASEEINKWNDNIENNIEFKCYIKPTEKLPKRLYTFQYDAIKMFNGILYDINLEELLDKSLN